MVTLLMLYIGLGTCFSFWRIIWWWKFWIVSM